MKFYALSEIVEKGKTKAFTAGASSSRSMSTKSGFRNPRNFFLWNLESWALESRIQLKESGTLLKIGIQNPNFTIKDRNPVPGIRNLGRGIHNPRLSFTLGDYSSLSVFHHRNQKKERKKKALRIDAVVFVVVVVFFRVQGKLIRVFWKRTINELIA